jgi:quercetin dioxygenase-like cupin family protein
LTVPEPIPVTGLPGSDRARRFEGANHGSSVSFYITRYENGEGPDLHRHPYEETFIVQEGEATYEVDGEEIVAGPGQIVVVPPGAAHKFKASGDGLLRQVAIHGAAAMVQEDLE